MAGLGGSCPWAQGGRRPKLSLEQQQLAADMAHGGISYHDDCDHARVLPAHGLQGAEARWRGRLKTGTL